MVRYLDHVLPRSFKVLKTSSYADLHQGLAGALVSVQALR